jgi:hypothetical protein
MESFDRLSRLSRRERAAFGVRAGLRVGAYFAVVAAALYPLVGRGERRAPGAIPLALGLLLGFLVAGVVFGILRPRVRDAYGAALLGAACVAPILFAVALALRGLTALNRSTGTALIAITLFVGGLLGTAAWRGWTRSASR